MGCDIHAFVEYHRGDYWESVAGEWNLHRSYRIFERMAGVRGEERNAVVAPRGIPDDLSHEAAGEYWIWIAYEGAARDDVTPEDAAMYVRGGCRYKGTRHESRSFTSGTAITMGKEGVSISSIPVQEHTHGAEYAGKPAYVSDPDAHTPSWLTLAEFESVFVRESILDQGREPAEFGYATALESMRVMESKGFRTRIVFWFDN